MPAWVITPDAVVIKICDCNWLKHGYIGDRPALYRGDPDNGGRFLMCPPAGSVVTFSHPNEVLDKQSSRNPATTSSALETALAAIRGRQLSWSDAGKVKDIKRELAQFDARSREFSP